MIYQIKSYKQKTIIAKIAIIVFFVFCKKTTLAGKLKWKGKVSFYFGGVKKKYEKVGLLFWYI